MRKLFAIALLFLALSASTKAATILVNMASNPNLFDPADIIIDVGDTVVWTNRTFVFHDTVSAIGVWQSPLFGIRGSFRFTFNVAPGVYSYYCTPHRPGMVGTVTVRGAVNNPPTATITSPADNSTFRPTDTITVNVNATDDGSIAKVELLVDGNITQTDTTLPYQFDLSLSTGQHTIAARATDDKNSATTSTPITVNISANNLPPTVAITSPADNSTFTEPANVTIQAQADDDVAIDHVEFLINGISAGVDSTAPYLTQTYTNGMYMVLARAFDGEGLQTTSAEIMFTVTEPIPDIPQVSIINPIEFDFIEFPFGSTIAQVPLVARAVDLNGSIAQVEFFTNSTSIGTAAFTGVSNQFLLTLPFAEGPHVITARATDNGGLVSTSRPVAFTVQMTITNTYRADLTNGFMRLGYFGSSGLDYIFESSADLVTFIPYMTNALVRRILFFDVPNDEQHRAFIAHPPAPGTVTPPAFLLLQSQFETPEPPPTPALSPLDPFCGVSKIKSLK